VGVSAVRGSAAWGERKARGMIRKTMRIGEIRTSIKLETEFWGYLKEVADSRCPAAVGAGQRGGGGDAGPHEPGVDVADVLAHPREVAHADPAEGAGQAGQLAGNTQDLVRVLDSCPLPSLVLDADRLIKQLNRAFALWLNLDAKGTVGQRLDNIMILRGPNMKEMWAGLADGRLGRAGFNATYVSPGKVRTSQAIALALGGGQAAGPAPRLRRDVRDPGRPQLSKADLTPALTATRRGRPAPGAGGPLHRPARARSSHIPRPRQRAGETLRRYALASRSTLRIASPRDAARPAMPARAGATAGSAGGCAWPLSEMIASGVDGDAAHGPLAAASCCLAIGQPVSNWAMVGRWAGHVPRGTIYPCDSIAAAAPVPDELASGLDRPLRRRDRLRRRLRPGDPPPARAGAFEHPQRARLRGAQHGRALVLLHAGDGQRGDGLARPRHPPRACTLAFLGHTVFGLGLARRHVPVLSDPAAAQPSHGPSFRPAAISAARVAPGGRRSWAPEPARPAAARPGGP
jgi:hypothetical protein